MQSGGVTLSENIALISRKVNIRVDIWKNWYILSNIYKTKEKNNTKKRYSIKEKYDA